MPQSMKKKAQLSLLWVSVAKWHYFNHYMLDYIPHPPNSSPPPPNPTPHPQEILETTFQEESFHTIRKALANIQRVNVFFITPRIYVI